MPEAIFGAKIAILTSRLFLEASLFFQNRPKNPVFGENRRPIPPQIGKNREKVGFGTNSSFSTRNRWVFSCGVLDNHPAKNRYLPVRHGFCEKPGFWGIYICIYYYHPPKSRNLRKTEVLGDPKIEGLLEILGDPEF